MKYRFWPAAGERPLNVSLMNDSQLVRYSFPTGCVSGASKPGRKYVFKSSPLSEELVDGEELSFKGFFDVDYPFDWGASPAAVRRTINIYGISRKLIFHRIYELNSV